MKRPTTNQIFTRNQLEGRPVRHQHAHLLFKVLSMETGGTFWLMEGRSGQPYQMPRHVHQYGTEVLYILEGRLSLQVKTKPQVLGPGDLAFIPHGIEHTYSVVDGPARWLNMGISSNFDQWYFEFGAPLVELTPSLETEFTNWNMAASLENYGTRIVGEPSILCNPTLISSTKGDNEMSATVTAMPILKGRFEEWKRVVKEATGKRRAELDDMHRRLNVSSARWFLQSTPDGDLAIIYLEGAGADTAFAAWGMSQHPFDTWFKQSIGPTYGIDFSAPPPGPGPQVMYQFNG